MRPAELGRARGPSDHRKPATRSQAPAASACIACGRPTRDATTDANGLARCAGCGLRWQPDPPRGADLAALYETGFYAPGRARGGGVVDRLHAANSRLRLRELRGLPPGRLLDVGSGKGHFMAAARAAGWEVLGVEYAAASAEEARDRYGLETIVGDALSIDLGGRFDAITMWHVLEHVADPAALIDRAHGLLGPRGRLVASVPNLGSAQARVFGRHWLHLDLPRHIYHFTPSALTALLVRHGFAIEGSDTAYPEMEFLGVVQSTINASGLEADRLYRFLKRDPEAPFDRTTIASLALAGAVSPLAAAWTVLAPLVRVGASLQVRARPA